MNTETEVLKEVMIGMLIRWKAEVVASCWTYKGKGGYSEYTQWDIYECSGCGREKDSLEIHSEYCPIQKIIDFVDESLDKLGHKKE